MNVHFRRLLCLVVLLQCQCAGEAARSAAEAPRGAITVVERIDIDKPMPLLAVTVLDTEISDLLYLPLLALRWEGGELHFLTSEEAPTALARSYELFGADSASLRYRLRSDVRWSDGRPVTAHDALWTLETRGDPRTASPRMDLNRQIDSIEAPDDTTLLIHFTRRYPEMVFHTAGAVAPRHLFGGVDPSELAEHPAIVDPVGGGLVVSGPYTIAEWASGQRLVLAPNPTFRPAPNIGRVVFRPIPEETTRMIELQTGGVDVMELSFDKLDFVRSTMPDFRLETREGRFYEYISYNPLSHPALAAREVRLALGLAIDLDELIAALDLGEYAEPAGGPYPPILRRLYDPEAQAPVPYDPERAASILDSEGWTTGPDGIRVREGRPLRITLSLNSGNQRRADIAQIVQQDWRAIGVDARIEVIEGNTFFDRLFGKEYQAAIAGWGVGLSPDISDLWTGEGPYNHTSLDDPDVNRMFDSALAQPTDEEAARYWREAAAHIVDARPYTWLYYLDQVIAVQDRVRNTRIDALATYQNLHEWRIAGTAAEQGGDAGISGR